MAQAATDFEAEAYVGIRRRSSVAEKLDRNARVRDVSADAAPSDEHQRVADVVMDHDAAEHAKAMRRNIRRSSRKRAALRIRIRRHLERG